MVSTPVIITGGGSPGLNQSEGWIDKLLPVGVLAVAGFLIYKLLFGSSSGTSDSSSIYGGGGYSGGTVQTPQVQSSGQDTMARNTGQGLVNIQQARQTQPVPGRSTLATLINSPVNPIIVPAGNGTPTNFFPGGTGVISTSRDLTPVEQQKVVLNLANSIASKDIQNAWWKPETITNPQNWGINAAGSPQSDIPSGTKHCACTAALKAAGVCGKGDDWYYC